MKNNFRYTFHALIMTVMLATLSFTAMAQRDRMRGMNVTDQVTVDDLETLNEWNVNVVRYQIVLDAASGGSESEYFAELELALQNLDALMPTLSQTGIKVVVDLHTPPGGFASLNFPAKFNLFVDDSYQEILKRVWESIAQRYIGNTNIYGFDILSEPATGSRRPSTEWLELAIELSEAILSIDPSRQLLVAPDYADPKKLKRFGKRMRKALGKELYKSNIIHNIHLFLPFKYVTQGVSRQVKKPLRYGTKKLNKRSFIKAIKRLKKSQRALKTRIFIGEFSVVRWAPKGDRYLRDFIRQLERSKWGWTYHIFREYHGWSVEHSENPRELARSTQETKRARVLKQFFRKNR